MTEWLLVFVFLLDPRTPALANLSVRTEQACEQKIAEVAGKGIQVIAHICIYMPDKMGSV